MGYQPNRYYYKRFRALAIFLSVVLIFLKIFNYALAYSDIPYRVPIIVFTISIFFDFGMLLIIISEQKHLLATAVWFTVSELFFTFISYIVMMATAEKIINFYMPNADVIEKVVIFIIGANIITVFLAMYILRFIGIWVVYRWSKTKKLTENEEKLQSEGEEEKSDSKTQLLHV